MVGTDSPLAVLAELKWSHNTETRIRSHFCHRAQSHIRFFKDLPVRDAADSSRHLHRKWPSFSVSHLPASDVIPSFYT